MIKIMILVSILLISSKINNILAQELEWDYPIKLGSPEWRKLDYPDGMLKASQIDASKLKTISSKGLVKIIMKYPYFTGYTVYDSPYLGFMGNILNFNGYQELLKRKDGYKAILKVFEEEDYEKLTSIKDTVERGGQTLVWIGLDMMLANDVEIAKLTKTEKHELLKTIGIKYEQKAKYMDDFGGFGNVTTLFMAKKIMKGLTIEKVISVEKQKKLKNFEEKMQLDDPELAGNIEKEFKEYVKNLN